MSERKLGALGKRLEKLKRIGYLESEPIPVPEAGLSLRLGLANNLEEAAVFKYAAEWEPGTVEYLYRLKLETISYAVVEILFDDGEKLDLRGVNVVDTGEPAPDGKTTLKQLRHEFVRGYASTWDRSVVDALYMVYQDLSEKSKEAIEKAAKIEIPAIRRVQELARVLAKVNEIAVDMSQDPDQPKSDFDKLIPMLEGSMKVAVLAALAKGVSVETRYDFTPDKDRDWTEAPLDEELTAQEIAETAPPEPVEVPMEEPEPEPEPIPVPEAERQLQEEEAEEALIPAAIPKR